MQITQGDDMPRSPGNPDYFTGEVSLGTVRSAQAPSTASVLRVTFQPRARTFWHTHPRGQTLYVLEGTCLVQTDGGAIAQLRPGDSVYFAPGEKHWHGAGPDGPMTHLAVQEAVDGSAADWLEAVSDAQYQGG